MTSCLVFKGQWRFISRSKAIYNVPIHIVLELALSEKSQGFGEVVIQNNSFVSDFANQKVLLLHLLFKGQRSFQLTLRDLKSFL